MVGWIALLLFFAQDSKSLDLSSQQAVELALANNLDLQIARFEPWIQEQNVLSLYGPFDTYLFSTGSYTDSKQSQTTLLGGADILSRDSFDSSIGLRKKLPFGATTELKFTSQQMRTNSSFALFSPVWTDSVGLTLTLPLLKGFGTQYTYSDILVQQSRHETSIHTFEKNLADTMFSVQRAYYELVFTAESRKVSLESLALARRLLDENIKKHKAELLAKIEVTRAEAEVAAEEQNVIIADQQWMNAMDRLRKLVQPSSLSAKEEIPLIPTQSPADVSAESDERALLEKMTNDAMARRADLRGAQKDLDIQDQLIAKTRNEMRPKFDLQASASYTGVDDTLGHSWHELGTFDTRDFFIGFAFEFPLENTGARNQLLRYELERRRSQTLLRNLEQTILLEVREAVRDIKTHEKRVRSAREQVRLTKERLEAEQAKQAQQLQTFYFVLEAQRESTRARVNEIRARVDYTIAWLALRRAAGTLLDELKISATRELSSRHP